MSSSLRKPKWLAKPLPKGASYEATRRLLKKTSLHTVCQEAKCPNLWECFSRHTATFLILGDRCTRNCQFCAIQHGPLGPPDPLEPKRVAHAARKLGLHYVVVTSVTRDDLPDGGAHHFAQTIQEIRRQIPKAKVEVLIPDFGGNDNALQTVLDAKPDILNHNIETVPRLYHTVRPGADYQRSLTLLAKAKAYAPSIPVKTGIMLGLGETKEEVRQTLEDLRKSGCAILTIGQYLQPSRHHAPVARYLPPEEFDEWKAIGHQMGFIDVFSGPFVRSSYHAETLYRKVLGPSSRPSTSTLEVSHA